MDLEFGIIGNLSEASWEEKPPFLIVRNSDELDRARACFFKKRFGGKKKIEMVA